MFLPVAKSLEARSVVETLASPHSMLKYMYPQAANLIALAPFPAVTTRTALMGSASLLDTFFLAPGFLAQQDAVKINNGEYPATAAMTSGYIFRVENQATVAFLQRVGVTGHLVTVDVTKASGISHIDPVASLCYLAGVASTVAVVLVLVKINDVPALMFLGTLMLSRLLNVIVLKRRAEKGWKGAAEPGVEGDLMVLVSQDRWIRMRGLVDDLKAVTAGHWLRELDSLESALATAATFLAYGALAFAGNASAVGSLFTAGLFVLSAALLGVCNAMTSKLCMFGCVVGKVGDTPYSRRKDMADDILRDTKALNYPDNSWALKLGLVAELPKGTSPTDPTIL